MKDIKENIKVCKFCKVGIMKESAILPIQIVCKCNECFKEVVFDALYWLKNTYNKNNGGSNNGGNNNYERTNS